MKLPGRLAALTLVGAAALFATDTLAHSEKLETVPADGAVLTSPPPTIGMTFDLPIRLTMLRLQDATGAVYDVTRTDDMAPVTEFEAVPTTLGPGSYTVEWRGLADDGHTMEGSFSFQIGN